MPHADPAARRAYLRNWKKQNRGKYARRQKATDAARHANERAKKYGAEGFITIDEAERILSVELCQYCGTSDPSPWWTLDHITPLHLKGSNSIENAACCCTPCNISKFRSIRTPDAALTWANQPQQWSGLVSTPRWSRLHDACVACGHAQRSHVAKGLCTTCYYRQRRASAQGPRHPASSSGR